MPDQTKALVKAAAAYEAMLAEVLRNAKAGVVPAYLDLSDRLATEHAQLVRSRPAPETAP